MTNDEIRMANHSSFEFRHSSLETSYPAWIRTRTKRAKISCATVTLLGSGEVGAAAFVPLRTVFYRRSRRHWGVTPGLFLATPRIDVSLRGLLRAKGRCNSCRRRSLKHESPEPRGLGIARIQKRRPVTSTHPATRRASRRT